MLSCGNRFPVLISNASLEMIMTSKRRLLPVALACLVRWPPMANQRYSDAGKPIWQFQDNRHQRGA